MSGCWLIAVARPLRIRDGATADDPVLEVSVDAPVWFRNLTKERLRSDKDVELVDKKAPTKKELEAQDEAQSQLASKRRAMHAKPKAEEAIDDGSADDSADGSPLHDEDDDDDLGDDDPRGAIE